MPIDGGSLGGYCIDETAARSVVDSLHHRGYKIIKDEPAMFPDRFGGLSVRKDIGEDFAKYGYHLTKNGPAENDKIAIAKSAAKDIIRWLENVDERMSPIGIINYLKHRLDPKAKAA